MKYFITCLLLLIVNNKINIIKAEVNYKTNLILNEENVFNYICNVGIIDPITSYKSILWESSHLKSKLSKKNNNITGMRCVKKRKTTQCGCKNGFGIYATWEECIIDYKLWQQHNKVYKYNKPYYKVLNILNYDTKDYGDKIIKIKLNNRIQKIVWQKLNGT